MSGITSDIIWKDCIEAFSDDFLRFFLPEFSEQIDFTQEIAFLDKELNEIRPKSAGKDRRCDDLIRVMLKDQREQWVLVHSEVQGYQDDEFALRMWEYHYRIWDRYQRNIVALAIFNDKNEGYRPAEYKKSYFGTEVIYRYNTYKILAQDIEQLKESENPFALVVLATIYAIRSEHNENLRFRFKRELLPMLARMKWSREKIEQLFLFIDLVITIQSEEKQRLVFQEFTNLLMEGESVMRVSWEMSDSGQVLKRMWRKEAMEEGREAGRVLGREEGREEGMERARNTMASNLLKEKCELDFVARVTGLTMDAVRELQKRLI